ncbi:MAG TPA: DUF5715 family protein [Vicinamibacterales bacterium]|nr:DUF5715 family protein [Vicinamibacterales bacterium]
MSLPLAAEAQGTNQAQFVRALDRMMVELAPQSTRDAKLIRSLYREHMDLLVLDHYADLEGALYTGGVAPLPPDPLQFNLAPRVSGPFPIGEKDLANQVSYIAARPATIGALLDIASRVKSGPIEVTSLVRHTEYQGALRATNKNATTSVPMHTMGLAFDIALVNTPLPRVYEIRDVLLKMRKRGDILFIGERKQLVFHVVPHPSRLGHFTDVYAQALGAPPAAAGAHVVAFSQVPEVKAGALVPSVTAEVVAVLPAVGFGEEWWAAAHDHGDLAVEVSAEAIAAPIERRTGTASPDRASAAPLVALLVAGAVLAWMHTQRRRDVVLLRGGHAGAQ